MESFATPYPLVFLNGEQEQDKGVVGIHSVLTFKRFQSLLSQKMGIPPNQLSAVFVCRKTYKGTEKKQRLPITASTNFNILLNQHNPNKEKDCYFLVSTKRSKERKGSRKRGAESEVPDEWESSGASPNAVEGRGFPPVEDYLSQGSSSSNFATEANSSASVTNTSYVSKRFMDNGMDCSQVPPNRVRRVILERGQGSTGSFLQRHGWSYGDSQHADGNIAEEYAQLHSPRFAALRPEDQRDLNLKWEESFQRRKACKPGGTTHDTCSFLHNVASQMEGDYHQNFCFSFPEGQVDNNSLCMRRNGRMGYSIYNPNMHGSRISEDPLAARGTFRNRELLHQKHSRPSFLGPRRAARLSLADLQEICGKEAISEGDWQKMPGASGAFADIQEATGCEDTGQSLFCRLCFECKWRNVVPIPFHWCVEDAVTYGFRGPSPAGPIGRRAKTLHIEATA